MNSTSSNRSARALLIAEVLDFVRAARHVSGITRIALIGSLTTNQPNPKDADLLVSVTQDADLAPLARLRRRLQGRAQSFNREVTSSGSIPWGIKGISPIAAEIHAKAPHLRPMETGSRDFDFRDGFLRRVLVRQQPFNEARNSVSSNGRLMGQSQGVLAEGLPSNSDNECLACKNARIGLIPLVMRR
jgi:predicted nucleotidyltransferase